MRSEEEIRYAIEQYADMVKKICFLHMKQKCDMEDVFQNVFLKYANSADFHDREHEKAWLIKVTMNACKDSLTSWFRKKVILSDELEGCSVVPEPIQDDRVLRAVMQLAENYRNVIYLYYYEEYKITEIATLLHKKENTIHTWLRRAKEQLRTMLGGDDFA